MTWNFLGTDLDVELEASPKLDDTVGFRLELSLLQISKVSCSVVKGELALLTIVGLLYLKKMSKS